MQSQFEAKKQQILRDLDVPENEYHDLSPKGSVDEPIRCLINEMNRLSGMVTTSSCSGRISVFLEGKKKVVQNIAIEKDRKAVPTGPGGKGGGSWLYISHYPVELGSSDLSSDFMTMFALQRRRDRLEQTLQSDCQYIHFKFEPMILHVLTASMDDSQKILTAALGAGFRESGALSLRPSKSGDINPVVAVRSTGYSLDAIIGYQNEQGDNVALVDENYLRTLVNIANERFRINYERIARFRAELLQQYTERQTGTSTLDNNAGWEDADVRRQRKRAEGLARQQQSQNQKSNKSPVPSSEVDEGVDIIFTHLDQETGKGQAMDT
ncbi:hypothetical protein K491DRAFT_675612 [Lophiostoma macrostomum CBS 122681]|uniref:tRNA(Phe) 7-[(3-amino-3-carboxypropyl)-4-demethylwyosine(37)-N(4)]-methyltransferase n=1 Tax=Lophiostoma macrostomum CBS 122681 TaxID=1314788 RepID=A0A6A6TJI9_9PLEO|nr:hypothetical protein K491DRAFT_675612 [Lophiostoma macrostomum CBS 122681]